MQHLILVILLLFSLPTFAANFMSEASLTTARGGGSGYSVYTSKGGCQQVEAADCFQIDGKDIRFHTIQQVRGGDFEAASSISDCADQAACEAQISDPVAKCGDVSYQALWGDLDGDDDPLGVRDLESWCTRQAFIDSLEEDAALKTAALAADSAQVVDNSARISARVARLAVVATCVSDVNAGGVLTGPQVQSCLDILIKEVFERNIATGDL